MITWPLQSGDVTLRGLAAIDIETTHLDPKLGEITEVGVILCDEHLVEQSRHHIRIQARLQNRSRVDPWIREHTAWGRATEAEWRQAGATPRTRAFARLGELLDGRALIAHHLPFERSWLQHHYSYWIDTMPGRAWITGDEWTRRSIDTRELASPLLAQGLIPGRSLRYCADIFGLTLDHHHPLSDAEVCLEVARRLLRRHALPPDADALISRVSRRAIEAEEEASHRRCQLVEIAHALGLTEPVAMDLETGSWPLPEMILARLKAMKGDT